MNIHEEWKIETYYTSGSTLTWIWVTFIDFCSTVSSSVAGIACTIIPLPRIMVLGKEVGSHDHHMTITCVNIIPHSVHAHCMGRRHRHPVAFHSGSQWSQFYNHSWKYPFHWYMCLHFDRDWNDTGSNLSHSHCPEKIKKIIQRMIYTLQLLAIINPPHMLTKLLALKLTV